VEFVNMATNTTVGRVAGTGLQNPTGIVFDPINQVFLPANSLLNNILIIDPNTLMQTSVRAGIAPSSIDYNFQTSTLVTVNSASHTMSVLAYVCPPSAGVPACSGPKVRTVLGLGGTRTSVPVFGPNAVAVDPKLNLAALVDPDNNRLLLVPLPH
jgi:DNA-binding beta-propeller fold protein YncE